MLIDLAEARKIALLSFRPARADVVNVTDPVTQTENVAVFVDGAPHQVHMPYLFRSYKYQFDKYNDVYRFVPLNGDVVGLCARTDLVADPWYSPGGFNRGQIRGALKLAYNPTQAQRDILYRKRVNPVTSFPGQGIVLFGDKTTLSKPSAFDRINVRRLFITLEKIHLYRILNSNYLSSTMSSLEHNLEIL